jgi:hypothetical protein
MWQLADLFGHGVFCCHSAADRSTSDRGLISCRGEGLDAGRVGRR